MLRKLARHLEARSLKRKNPDKTQMFPGGYRDQYINDLVFRKQMQDMGRGITFVKDNWDNKATAQQQQPHNKVQMQSVPLPAQTPQTPPTGNSPSNSQSIAAFGVNRHLKGFKHEMSRGAKKGLKNAVHKRTLSGKSLGTDEEMEVINTTRKSQNRSVDNT